MDLGALRREHRGGHVLPGVGPYRGAVAMVSGETKNEPLFSVKYPC